MDEEISVAELRLQLAQHEKDKDELQAAMFADPSDEELPALVAELDEAIQLVRDLISLQAHEQQPATPQPPRPQEHAYALAHTPPFANAPAVAYAPAHVDARAQPPPPPGTSSEIYVPNPPSAPVGGGPPSFPTPPTANVVALASQPATAYQAAAAVSTGGQAVSVVGGGVVAVLPSAKTNALLLPWAEGDECEVKWVSDGKWYRAVVESIDATTATVHYKAYGTHDAVPLTHLRALPLAEKRKREASRVEAKIKYEEVSIPESLRIQPGDDEATRARKKKRAHAIQWRNRKAKVDVEHNQRQNAWQQFRTGGQSSSGGGKKKKSKKSRKGGARGLAGLSSRKKSIFATSDSYSARVGVTGSGQGMTKNPEQRLKFSRSGELQNR
jgi:Tudor domain